MGLTEEEKGRLKLFRNEKLDRNQTEVILGRKLDDAEWNSRNIIATVKLSQLLKNKKESKPKPEPSAAINYGSTRNIIIALCGKTIMYGKIKDLRYHQKAYRNV